MISFHYYSSHTRTGQLRRPISVSKCDYDRCVYVCECVCARERPPCLIPTRLRSLLQTLRDIYMQIEVKALKVALKVISYVINGFHCFISCFKAEQRFMSIMSYTAFHLLLLYDYDLTYLFFWVQHYWKVYPSADIQKTHSSQQEAVLF